MQNFLCNQCHCLDTNVANRYTEDVPANKDIEQSSLVADWLTGLAHGLHFSSVRTQTLDRIHLEAAHEGHTVPTVQPRIVAFLLQFVV